MSGKNQKMLRRSFKKNHNQLGNEFFESFIEQLIDLPFWTKFKLLFMSGKK